MPRKPASSRMLGSASSRGTPPPSMTCFSCSVSCQRIGIGLWASTRRRIGILILYDDTSTVVRLSTPPRNHGDAFEGVGRDDAWPVRAPATCSSPAQALGAVSGRIEGGRPRPGRAHDLGARAGYRSLSRAPGLSGEPHQENPSVRRADRGIFAQEGPSAGYHIWCRRETDGTDLDDVVDLASASERNHPGGGTQLACLGTCAYRSRTRSLLRLTSGTGRSPSSPASCPRPSSPSASPRPGPCRGVRSRTAGRTPTPARRRCDGPGP